GLSAEECAEGIIKVIAATMARGVRKVSVERGIDVRSCHLMSFGGAGPLHGADLVHELGMQTAVIPPLPGIASAVGMLDAPIRHDFAEPVQADYSSGLEQLESSYNRLIKEAQEEMSTDDFDSERLVDARYVGQIYELTIPYLSDWDEQRPAFDDAHEQRYGFQDPDAEMEIVVTRIVATIGLPIPPQQEIASGDETSVSPKEHRPVYIDGEW